MNINLFRLFFIAVFLSSLLSSCNDDRIIAYRLDGWKSVGFYYDNAFHDPSKLTRPYFLTHDVIRDSVYHCNADTSWMVPKVRDNGDTVYFAWMNHSKYYPLACISIIRDTCRGVFYDEEGSPSAFVFNISRSERILVNYGIDKVLSTDNRSKDTISTISSVVDGENVNCIKIANRSYSVDYTFDIRDADNSLLLFLDIALTILDNHRNSLSNYSELHNFWNMFINQYRNFSPFIPPPPGG